MAREHSPPLLQLSHHGWVGHDLHRDYGCVALSTLARQAVRCPLDAVDFIVEPALSVYRQYCRMDDCGVGPATVVGLRFDAYGGRVLQNSVGGKWNVHAVGIHGHLHGAGNSVPVPDSARDRARACRRPGSGSLKDVMETLWFMVVAVMVAAYVVLDGFDLGAGAIYLFVAKS